MSDLEFLGVTSPATCLRETAEATARLVARALAEGCERVLVDTSGLVQGDLGRALKRVKIDRVRPDVVIALERAAECEPILRAYAGGSPALVRLPAAPTTPRSALARRRQRVQALETHLAGDFAGVAAVTAGASAADGFSAGRGAGLLSACLVSAGLNAFGSGLASVVLASVVLGLAGGVPLVGWAVGITRLPPGASPEIGLWLIACASIGALLGLALDALGPPQARRSESSSGESDR